MELFERRNKGLRFNNYTYRLAEVNKKSKRFRCTKKDCPASLLTDCDEQNIVKIGNRITTKRHQLMQKKCRGPCKYKEKSRGQP
ncbi:hypothetical protein ElyMa_003557300 [Elysia marginata]|uniref:FLYWCH-type domain-containing protein n=1 Tax=Elysia marginata TaxID=1093978 RepID=A0AAV4EKX1_9GAST|nr:hypothetical protein ElyMa_003557300 [Elysia marginata]